MVVFPNAKINLGLHVIARRPDGYHDIETLFYPVPLRDALEIIPASDGMTRFKITGLDVPGDSHANLCTRAYELIKNEFDLPPVHMHLHKVIPMGAGLGGGSSDGACTITLLNTMFNLHLTTGKMKEIALELGSDCPFFIENQPRFAYGRGNELLEANINLSGLYLMIVVPPAHVATALAYAGITPKKPVVSLKEILEEQPEAWRENLVNDFEPSVFRKYPVIGEIKKRLYESGALYASMSGSGSAVYGLFTERPDLTDKFPGCFMYVTRDT
jgi:4-diphosphocytidyl-2-C-methyl-D-erythritol kinase